MSARPQVAKATILAVDDEPAILDIIEKFLGKAGYRILQANSATEALDIFGKADAGIDLLLCDYLMPDMNGSQLVESLRRTQPTLPVIVISGSYDARDKMSTDGFTHLDKPFLLRELLTAVKKVLE